MRRNGFTIVELLTVIVMVSAMTMMAVPHLRVSPSRKVRTAAMQLVRDLELARTRALATRTAVRVAFDLPGDSYVGYLDEDRDGAFAGSQSEIQALRARGRVKLASDVTFSRGSAGAVPGDLASGPVTFADAIIEFSGRGVTVPFGASGMIYFAHREVPDAVAAVSVSGAASFRIWVYRGGIWQ